MNCNNPILNCRCQEDFKKYIFVQQTLQLKLGQKLVNVFIKKKMETSLGINFAIARSVFFLQEGVEGNDEAHVEDPNEGVAHHNHDCEQEDPKLR